MPLSTSVPLRDVIYRRPLIFSQVSGLETNLSFMTEKVHILQKNYVEMHELALKEIDTLKSHIEELKSRQHGKGTFK